MKIVHIFYGLTFGGIETMLVNIANAQVAAGAEVSVIVINDLYDDSLVRSFVSSVTLVFLHRKPHSRSLGFLIGLNLSLHRIKPDAIHLHNSGIYKMIFSRRLSRVASVTLHDLPRGSVRREGLLFKVFPFLNFIYNNGNVTFIDEVPKVFAISDAVKNALYENYGVGSIVINNGIRTNSFSIRSIKSCGSPFRIVQVSRLEHDKKGQDLLIQAISKLNGIAEVWFIGEGQSLNYLMQLSADLSVEHLVHFLGKQSQEYITRHLCEYDLFVQPSRYEGFGLTVAEAMASQVPVVVSAGQGPAEVTCGDRYGWVFENGDVEALARLIAYVHGHYDEALRKVADARRYVMETYDVSVTAKRYMEEY